MSRLWYRKVQFLIICLHRSLTGHRLATTQMLQKVLRPTRQIRWRRIIRNLTIRNRDSHRLIFLSCFLRVKELVNSDYRFGFCMKNCIYSKLEMSRILNCEPKIRNVQTLAPKHANSYHMYPPYSDNKTRLKSLHVVDAT